MLGPSTRYRGARGLDPALIKELEKQYGFDKPPLQRFWLMMRNYLTFNFGTSFFRDRSVVDLIKDKLPVSISIGLWTTLITYLVSIPLGIRKAVGTAAGSTCGPAPSSSSAMRCRASCSRCC